MRASCTCTSTIMLRAGAVVCATCGAPIVEETVSTPSEVSSVKLPADAKSADAFNRACRSGRVDGARKVGRVWIATLDAWNRRAAAPAPSGVPARARVTRYRGVTGNAGALPSVSDAALLAELGLETRRTG